MNCCASAVITTRTSHPAFVSNDAKSAALWAAIEPVTPRTIVLFMLNFVFILPRIQRLEPVVVDCQHGISHLTFPVKFSLTGGDAPTARCNRSF